MGFFVFIKMRPQSIDFASLPALSDLQRIWYAVLGQPNETPPQDLTSVEFWTELEKKLIAVSPDSTLFPKKQASWSTSEQIKQNLLSAGIGLTKNATDHEIQRGISLVQALIRRTHHFTTDDAASLTPHLTNGAFSFPPYLWNEFTNTWGRFYGAPWMGIVMHPLPAMHPAECFWCNKEFYTVLSKLGEAYVKKLLAEGMNEEDAFNKAIKVLYTGKPFGGMIDHRVDFSQIGFSAALDLSNVNEHDMIILCDALFETDPSYRIRLYNNSLRKEFKHTPPGSNNHSLPDKPANLFFSPFFIKTAVVEPDPQYEKLLEKPAMVKRMFHEDPALFNRIPVARLAKAVAQNGGHLSTEEYRITFSVIREAGGGNLFTELLAGLSVHHGLGSLIERVDLENANVIHTMMNINLEILEEIIPDGKLEEINQKLIAVFKKWKEYANLSFDLEQINYKVIIADILKA